MKWLNCEKMRLAIFGFLAMIIIGSGNAKADFYFGEPTNLGPIINSTAMDYGPCISGDGLSLFFSSKRDGGYGDTDLYMATRPTTDDEWGTPINLGPTINSSSRDVESDISTDGLELYFESRRLGGFGWADIWVAKRQTKDDLWEEPVNLGSVINSSDGDGQPSISFDGLELYYVSGSMGGDSDLFVSTRSTISDDWGDPIQLVQVNPPGIEWSPSISADGRLLIFSVSQNGVPVDLWITIRDLVSGDWNPPVKLEAPINSTFDEYSAEISADGRVIYFESSRPDGFGKEDIWQAPIIPIVDLNGDGIVDAADMCIMVDNWGTDNQLCDVGPMPWGDGIVDVEDLIVLAEHLFEEFPPEEVEPVE